jgi:hypothetical protein
MKDISAAIVLADHFHSQSFRFKATGELAENFGSCPEEKAYVYFEERVKGEVTDVYGRQIKIPQDGVKSMYKEKETERHVIAPENYEEVRGKRLPWIRYTLAKSSAIYVNEETVSGSFRRSFLYTAIVSVPLSPKTGQPIPNPQISYYVVVVREMRSGELEFVTAYSMFKLNKFLSMIATAKIFDPKGRK